MPTPQPTEPQPLKPLVFEILLALVDAPCHGYGLAKILASRSGAPAILPANLYRTLRDLCARGWLIETDERPQADDDSRRRYFRMTAAGRRAVRAEAERLDRLVAEARDKQLLTVGRQARGT